MIPGVGYESKQQTSIIQTINANIHTKILLLRPSSSKVCAIPPMALRYVSRRGFLPMVLLGLLPGLLSYRWKIHW